MLVLVSDPFGPDLPERLARFGTVTDDKRRLAQVTQETAPKETAK
jgi:hypothetical protein